MYYYTEDDGKTFMAQIAARDEYDRGYLKGKSEGIGIGRQVTANEIFAELEKAMVELPTEFLSYKGIDSKALNELKKKYTEAANDT